MLRRTPTRVRAAAGHGAEGNTSLHAKGREGPGIQMLVPQYGSYFDKTLQLSSPGGGGITDRREWDHIDVQVVMSKELRQRVLLCQFLRKVPNYGAGLGGLLLYGIAGGTAPLPLQDSPKTMAFISRLKRDLTQSQLCLSSLYDAPPHTVCALPQPEGVDPHFRAQLHRSLWANMWGQLERDVGDMGEHLQAQNRQCFEFLQTLEPIYKQYGMPPPAPWSVHSRRHSRRGSGNSSGKGGGGGGGAGIGTEAGTAQVGTGTGTESGTGTGTGTELVPPPDPSPRTHAQHELSPAAAAKMQMLKSQGMCNPLYAIMFYTPSFYNPLSLYYNFLY